MGVVTNTYPFHIHNYAIASEAIYALKLGVYASDNMDFVSIAREVSQC
jgi:hypothetical protein